MEAHMDTCLWFYGWIIVMIFFITYNVTLEFIELFEYNENNVSEIVIVYDNFSEIITIEFDDIQW